MIGSAAIAALGTEASGHWLDPSYVLNSSEQFALLANRGGSLMAARLDCQSIHGFRARKG